MQAQEPLDSLSLFLGFQGFVVRSIWVEPAPKSGEPGRRIKVIRVEDTRKRHACPDCGRRRKGLFQEAECVRIRACSIGDFETYIEVRPYRIRCCGGTRVERLPFQAEGHRMTRRFFERVAALARRLTVFAVAEMAKTSWDTVARVDKEATMFALGGPTPSLGKKLRWIGIDEVSRNGGRSYFTIVSNLETGKVVFVGEGKGKEAVAPFLEKLGKKRIRRVRGAVSDLGYQSMIETHFPQATHLLDRFHVVQWMNEALSKLRRRIFGGAPKDTTGKTLKVKKWLLLKAREKLELKHKLELARLLKLNRPLYKAYVLKEQLRQILHHPWKYLKALRRNLRNWCNAMSWSQIDELKAVSKRIRTSMEKIVLRYKHLDIPMGLVEALNGNIAQLRREARGYRDIEHFKLKIYQRCSLENDPWRSIIL